MREHEKLAIYPQVKAAAHAVERVARQIPASHADLRSQLRSAFNSVALNLAEGANEYSPAEKARLYRISRRSAGECLAALDLCDAMVPGDVPTSEAKALLDQSSTFLTALILGQGKRASP